MFGLKKKLSFLHFRRKKAVMTMKIVIDAIVLLAIDQEIWVLANSINMDRLKKTMNGVSTFGTIASVFPGFGTTIGLVAVGGASVVNTVAAADFLKNKPILLGDVITNTTEEQKERLTELIACATSLKASSERELFRKLKKDPLQQKVVLDVVFDFIKAEKNMDVVTIE